MAIKTLRTTNAIDLVTILIWTGFNIHYYRPRTREKILRESAPEQDTLSASGFSPVRHKDLHISEWQDGLPAHYSLIQGDIKE